MQFSIIAVCIAFLVINSWALADAGTFPPFVRSRYSLRWRKTTTTSPKINESLTTSGSALKELSSTTTVNSAFENDSTIKLIKLATTNVEATTVVSKHMLPMKPHRNGVVSSSSSSSSSQFPFPSPPPPLFPSSSPSPQSFVTLKRTTAVEVLPHQQFGTESTTVHPKEKHLHNLAEYDYYDNGDIEEADERQHT